MAARRNQSWLAIVAIGTILGLGLYFTIADGSAGNRVVAGNTAGSISVLFEVDDARILIGAGPTRSHAADLVGRSTYPWDRRLDMLVIPGWDDYHAIGALGLLERQHVEGIAVVGLGGDDPVWTMLEREAQRQDVPVRYLDRAHKLELSEVSTLTLLPGTDAAPQTFIRLLHDGLAFDLVDSDVPFAGPERTAIEGYSDHVLITMRSRQLDRVSSPGLLIRPQPFVTRDLEEARARFIGDLPRNERLTITFSSTELRVPLERLKLEPAETGSASN